MAIGEENIDKEEESLEIFEEEDIDEPYEITKNQIADNGSTEDSSDTMISKMVSDKKKVVLLVAGFLFIVGSYFNFWSLYRSDAGIMHQGNLFGGYMAGGILGKICVIMVVLSFVAIFINKVKINFIVSMALIVSYVLQCLFIVIAGRNELGSMSAVVIPGLGFIICTVMLIIVTICSIILFKKGAK